MQDKDNRETLAERQGDRRSALNESWQRLKDMKCAKAWMCWAVALAHYGRKIYD